MPPLLEKIATLELEISRPGWVESENVLVSLGCERALDKPIFNRSFLNEF